MSRWLRIGLGLWAGLLVWVIVVVALLFAQLPDRAAAGALAGSLFRWATFLSAGFALVLAIISPGSWRARVLLLVPAALLLGNEFLLRPVLRATRLGNGFALWHGLASALYVLATVLVLVFWWRAEFRREE